MAISGYYVNYTSKGKKYRTHFSSLSSAKRELAGLKRDAKVNKGYFQNANITTSKGKKYKPRTKRRKATRRSVSWKPPRRKKQKRMGDISGDLYGGLW